MVDGRAGSRRSPQGRLGAARAGYEEILQLDSEHFDALHLLGVIALQEMRAEEGDLVISVDTSVVHLVGGMGKPVWIRSRFDGCWRWLLDRDDSPWYPTARLFRQRSPGDWTSVIERVAAALHAWQRDAGAG